MRLMTAICVVKSIYNNNLKNLANAAILVDIGPKNATMGAVVSAWSAQRCVFVGNTDEENLS